MFFFFQLYNLYLVIFQTSHVTLGSLQFSVKILHLVFKLLEHGKHIIFFFLPTSDNSDT